MKKILFAAIIFIFTIVNTNAFFNSFEETPEENHFVSEAFNDLINFANQYSFEENDNKKIEVQNISDLEIEINPEAKANLFNNLEKLDKSNTLSDDEVVDDFINFIDKGINVK